LVVFPFLNESLLKSKKTTLIYLPNKRVINFNFVHLSDSQDCSIQLSCFYLFLIFCFTLPSVLSFDASNKVITTPTFTLVERALLRKTFLNKFGLSHLNNLKKQENSTPKVPGYVWNLYRRLQQRKADFTTIRHFSTYSLEFLSNGYAKLVFNLSLGGKQFENVRH